MHRLTGTKREIIWTKPQSKPKSTPRCDKKWLSKLYQNPNQQMIEEKSSQHMIDSITHQYMKCDINRYRIKTTHD